MSLCPQSHNKRGRSRRAPSLAGEYALLVGLRENMHDPDARIEGIAWNDRLVAVQAGGRAGMASLGGARPGPDVSGLLNRLRGSTLHTASGLVLDDRPFARSLGLAVLGSGFERPETGASDILGLVLAAGMGGVVSVVGGFPFADRIATSVDRLHTFPCWSREAAPKARCAIEESDVVLISSALLLTRSMVSLLDLAHGAVTVVAGPSTPFGRELFRHGVDVLAGPGVQCAPSVLDGIARGESGRQLSRRGLRPASLNATEGRVAC
jgi:hypothetical protein